MSSPVDEKEQYSFPAFEPHQPLNVPQERRSSDEDGTLQGEPPDHHIDNNHLRATTSYAKGHDYLDVPGRDSSPMSFSAQREQSRRLEDDLEMLRAERVVSNAERSSQDSINRSKSRARSRSRTNAEPIDDFDVGSTPLHEKTKTYQPPANPTTKIARLLKKVHGKSFLVRYFCYITPLCLLLLIPMLFGLLLFKQATVGGVKLFWFGIWLQIVWLTLWLARIIAKCIPWPMGMISSLVTNNAKKWRDLGKALEVPATLFFWLLAVEISFLPTMKNHHLNGDKSTQSWELTVNKVIISLFVAAILNFVEKIIIQLIAISFHLRTYADRIEVNKFQIGSLIKLYIYSKEKIAMEDYEFEENKTGPSSGARTPMAYVNKAQKNARHVFNKVGDVAGKVAGDFTGKAVTSSTHPQQVVLQLLGTTTGSQVLARRLYRTYQHEDSETVLSYDLRPAFDNDDEADAAFTMFDKDLNGDISMEELEAVCVEIGRERKAIMASLKDLDAVVSKLDDILLFAVAVVTLLVFVSLISTSASTAITSLGSTVLALSWLFSATAQEFLQSIIFVFVKHPFDVGDRVTIYGNTGSQMKGDDYFVKEISLLFTEFKKMEGHVVQAPNSYLNTLFILNQRRSGGLAEAVPVTVKFGTSLEQIETLRNRLLEFVTAENREYQKNILTELTTIYEAYSITLNVVFFYKSSWQNELLRLQRRNKFICAMMVTMQELGMEGPRMKLAGAGPDYPMYLNDAYPHHSSNSDQQPPGPGPHSGSLAREGSPTPEVASAFSPSLPTYPASGPPMHPQPQPMMTHRSSILRNRNASSFRQRDESISQMGKRVDFSLGMSSISSGADFGDVYEDRKPRLPLPPQIATSSPSPTPNHGRSSRDSARDHPSHETDSLTNTLSRGSMSMGRVLSRPSTSISTSNRNTHTHRNRFFSRGRRSKLGGCSASADEGMDLEDLEAGTGIGMGMGMASRDVVTVNDMPAIPEAKAKAGGANVTNSANWREEETENEEELEVERADVGAGAGIGVGAGGIGTGIGHDGKKRAGTGTTTTTMTQL